MASETYCGACGDHAPTILGRCASCWGDRPLETALADMVLLAREAEEARDADEEIARLTRELEEARERERGYREALCQALDRGFPGDTHEGDCAVTRGMQCDCWIGQARVLASTPPDTEGGEAEHPAHPVRMAQPDEKVAL